MLVDLPTINIHDTVNCNGKKMFELQNVTDQRTNIFALKKQESK